MNIDFTIYREPPPQPELKPGDVVTLINGIGTEPVRLLVSTVTPQDDGTNRVTFWPPPAEADDSA